MTQGKERAEPGDEHINPKVALGALVSLVAYFCKECGNRISMLENKISDSYRLLAKMLFFCLGEAIALAQLVHEIGYGANNDVLIWGSFRHCIQVIQGSLCSTNIQVQMLGIHVLKTCAQREVTEGSQTKTHSFVMILGELLVDVFSVMQATLKKCSSKESINIIDECLKLLFLFHTLSQSEKHQQDATILLLDALMVVFYLSSDSGSQELTEVNTISKKLFSHFIQIPSAAIQIKDIMLSAPPTKRQQLQDMIRASVSQGQIMAPVNTRAQSEQNVEVSSNQRPGSIAIVSDANAVEGKDEKELSDDDWDTFQSLPATAAKDDADSAIGVSPIREQGSAANSHQKLIPHGNTNHDVSDTDAAAGATEGRNSVDKEFEEPSASQCSSIEQQVKSEFPELSYEDDEEVPKHPTVDCAEPSAHILWKEKARDELQEDHDDPFGCKERKSDLDLPEEGTDPASDENKGASGEIVRSEGDALDENIASINDSTSSLNNLSDVMDDEAKKVSDMLLIGDDKSAMDNEDCGEELAPSSHAANITDASMSGNVTSTSEADGHPDNVDTNPESSECESA